MEKQNESINDMLTKDLHSLLIKLHYDAKRQNLSLKKWFIIFFRAYVVSIVLALATYFFFSFVMMSYDIKSWDYGMRFLYGLIVILPFVVVCFNFWFSGINMLVNKRKLEKMIVSVYDIGMYAEKVKHYNYNNVDYLVSPEFDELMMKTDGEIILKAIMYNLK